MDSNESTQRQQDKQLNDKADNPRGLMCTISENENNVDCPDNEILKKIWNSLPEHDRKSLLEKLKNE
ncbi:MAG TPA: hypothetical protein PKB02_09545 [Anaerohalosphaeraceae bacterium]|nr:hypothetical protein [Anaerohalosphaeraceae bacterium]